MMILDHRLDRRDFLILSGSAAALAMATSVGCGVTRPKPDPDLIDGFAFDLTDTCRCPECIRREVAGPWQVPAETSQFWAHLRGEYECKHKYLPWFEGDPTWH